MLHDSSYLLVHENAPVNIAATARKITVLTCFVVVSCTSCLHVWGIKQRFVNTYRFGRYRYRSKCAKLHTVATSSGDHATIACSRHFTHVLSSRPSQSWWMRVRRCASEIYCSKLTISFLMLLFGKGTIFCWTDTNRHRQTRFSSTNLKPNKFCEVSLLLKKFCPFHLRLQRNFAWPCYWELRSSSPWIIIWKY